MRVHIRQRLLQERFELLGKTALVDAGFTAGSLGIEKRLEVASRVLTSLYILVSSTGGYVSDEDARLRGRVSDDGSHNLLRLFRNDLFGVAAACQHYGLYLVRRKDCLGIRLTPSCPVQAGTLPQNHRNWIRAVPPIQASTHKTAG